MKCFSYRKWKFKVRGKFNFLKLWIQNFIPSHGWKLRISSSVKNINLETSASNLKIFPVKILHSGLVIYIKVAFEQPLDDGRFTHKTISHDNQAKPGCIAHFANNFWSSLNCKNIVNDTCRKRPGDWYHKKLCQSNIWNWEFAKCCAWYLDIVGFLGAWY